MSGWDSERATPGVFAFLWNGAAVRLWASVTVVLQTRSELKQLEITSDLKCSSSYKHNKLLLLCVFNCFWCRKDFPWITSSQTDLFYLRICWRKPTGGGNAVVIGRAWRFIIPGLWHIDFIFTLLSRWIDSVCVLVWIQSLKLRQSQLKCAGVDQPAAPTIQRRGNDNTRKRLNKQRVLPVCDSEGFLDPNQESQSESLWRVFYITHSWQHLASAEV